MAEEGVGSTAEASLAKARFHSRQWWAAKLNRGKYGEGRQKVDVNVSIQDLHLDALRKKASMEQLPDAEPDAVEADYEVVEDLPSREQLAGPNFGDRPGED